MPTVVHIPKTLFVADYGFKTRAQLHQILYKRKQALINNEARLLSHRATLAKIEADEDIPAAYAPYMIKHTRYLIQSAEYDIEVRKCDIELVKAFIKDAPFRK